MHGTREKTNKMIVLRRKSKVFAQQGNGSQPTSNDLLAEQMKLQRQVMETQKQREKLRSEETRKRLQIMQRTQRMQNEKEEEEREDRIKAKKLEMENNKPDNQSLYKSKSKIVTPIPMRG